MASYAASTSKPKSIMRRLASISRLKGSPVGTSDSDAPPVPVTTLPSSRQEARRLVLPDGDVPQQRAPSFIPSRPAPKPKPSLTPADVVKREWEHTNKGAQALAAAAEFHRMQTFKFGGNASLSNPHTEQSRVAATRRPMQKRPPPLKLGPSNFAESTPTLLTHPPSPSNQSLAEFAASQLSAPPVMVAHSMPLSIQSSPGTEELLLFPLPPTPGRPRDHASLVPMPMTAPLLPHWGGVSSKPSLSKGSSMLDIRSPASSGTPTLSTCYSASASSASASSHSDQEDHYGVQAPRTAPLSRPTLNELAIPHEPHPDADKKKRRMSVSASLGNLRRSIVITLGSKQSAKRGSCAPQLAQVQGGPKPALSSKHFDASHLPPSPSLPVGLRQCPSYASMRTMPSMIQNHGGGDALRGRSRSPSRSPKSAVRACLDPEVRFSAGELEGVKRGTSKEETRRLSDREMAFF